MAETPNTEQIKEQAVPPVPAPETQPAPVKSVKSTGGLNINIKGLWIGRAGVVAPEPSITASVTDEKLFYMIESSGSGYGVINHETKVFINEDMTTIETGQIKEGDSTDTGVILVPSRFRTPGATINVVIEILQFTVEGSKRTTIFKNATPFTVKYN